MRGRVATCAALASAALLVPRQFGQRPAVSAPSSTLPPAITHLLAKHKGVELGTWGMKIVNLTSGRVVFAKDSNHFFTPASNAKLFSTAYALTRLGPDHRFVTRITIPAKPGDDGVVQGDLTVIGGGDPTISGRSYADPAQANASDDDASDPSTVVPADRPAPVATDAPPDPFAPIDDLVRQIAAAGVKRIHGDIIGDDRAYVWEPHPTGWAVDDTFNEDGAPVSPLIFADNRVQVKLEATDQDGDPARVTITPDTGYLQIASLVTSGPRTHIQQQRDLGTRQGRLLGEVKRSTTESLAIDDPARYFAYVLRERLLEAGIAVDGVARALHLYSRDSIAVEPSSGVEIARRESPPLAAIIHYVNKASQNLHAEVLLREAARQPNQPVTRAIALGGLRDFLAANSIDEDEVALFDGSGLSRLDLVTPDAVVKLLGLMSTNDVFTGSLPVGGKDGTLRDRFGGRKRTGTVTAKTGTLRHVTALSGYAEGPSKQRFAFSILTNNVNLSSAAARSFVDELVALFVR